MKIGISSIKKMKKERDLIFKASEGFISDKSTLYAIPTTELEIFYWIKSMEKNEGTSLNQKIIREKAVEINNNIVEKENFSFYTGCHRNFVVDITSIILRAICMQV